MAAETATTESLETRVAKLEGALPFLGTKEDIGELRNEISALRSKMHSEISALRSEMHDAIGTLRNEMHSQHGSLRAEVGELRGELKSLRWTTTLGLTLLGVVMGVLMFVLR